MILDDWFQTEQGKNIAEAFVLQLDSYRKHFVGKNMLQLGSCDKNTWLSLFNFKNIWITSLDRANLRSSLLASPIELPFAKHSVDCILAPLTLELTGATAQLLNEIDRVLKPMGHVVFFGINPFSFWGLAFKLSLIPSFKQDSVHLTSFFKLQHDLDALGYQQCVLKHFYFIPPFMKPTWLHNLNFLNQMGNIIAPMPAGFYCMIVQKYTPDLLFSAWDTLDEPLSFASP